MVQTALHLSVYITVVDESSSLWIAVQTRWPHVFLLISLPLCLLEKKYSIINECFY